MSDKPADFERACAVFKAAAGVSDEALIDDEVRRGMLAALKAMREPSDDLVQIGAEQQFPNQTVTADWSWQAMLDELIRQGEQQGPGAG